MMLRLLKRLTLKESREEVEELKHQSNVLIEKKVKESTNRSNRAAQKFDRMSLEMKDIAAKINMATGKTK